MNLIKRFFSKAIETQAVELFNKWKDAEQAEKDRSNRQIAEFSVGTPVICISNEWDDPVVGFVTHIEYITKAQNPVPVVMDYLSGREVMVMGAVYDFTDQRLDAFLKLAPYERWVMAQRHGFHHYSKDLSIEELLEMSMNPKRLLSSEEVYDKLIKSGFYDNHVKFMENLAKDE
jgi:hypothetical protein